MQSVTDTTTTTACMLHLSVSYHLCVYLQIEDLGTERIVAMAAGFSHAAAVSEDGKLFMWGMKRYLEPEHMVALDGHTVVDVG